MDNQVLKSPWTEWKEWQEKKIEEERLSRFSSWKKTDFASHIRELMKIKKIMDENQKRFINRLARYDDGQKLTYDEVKYLAYLYHELKEGSVGHAERCPLCNGSAPPEND